MENRPGSKAFEQARQALLEAASGPRGAIPSGVAVPVGPDVDCQVLCAVMGSNPPGVAPNTQAAYRSALSKLNEWLEGKPLNDESLADYLVFLFLEKKSPAVAAQAISACTASAQLAGQWRPSGPRTAAILAGYRKSAGNRGTGRVQPLQWPQLERCVSLAADGSPRGLRDAALLLVMWDAMLDASQIRAVDMEDLEFLPDGTAALRVVVREGMAERRRLQQQTVLRLQNWRYCFPRPACRAVVLPAGQVREAAHAPDPPGHPVDRADPRPGRTGLRAHQQSLRANGRGADVGATAGSADPRPSLARNAANRPEFAANTAGRLARASVACGQEVFLMIGMPDGIGGYGKQERSKGYAGFIKSMRENTGIKDGYPVLKSGVISAMIRMPHCDPENAPSLLYGQAGYAMSASRARCCASF